MFSAAWQDPSADAGRTEPVEMPPPPDAARLLDIGYAQGLVDATELVHARQPAVRHPAAVHSPEVIITGPLRSMDAAGIQKLLDWSMLKPQDILQKTTDRGFVKLYEFRCMYWDGPDVFVRQVPRVDLEIKHYEAVVKELKGLGRDTDEIEDYILSLKEEDQR